MTIKSLESLKPHWLSSRTYKKHILYTSILLCIINECYFLGLFIYMFMLCNGALVNNFTSQTGLTECSELFSSIPFEEVLEEEEIFLYDVYLEYVLEGAALLYDDYEHNDLMSDIEWFDDLHYEYKLLNIIKIK